MTLRAILDCAEDSFSHNDENRDVWMAIRSQCEVLLGAKDFYRYQKLFQKDGFNYEREENRLSDWQDLVDKFNPDNEDIGSSNYEGLSDLCDDFENNSKVMRERVIAYHQLKAFSLYFEDKPNMSAAYREFLVSVYSLLHDILLS